ncbi:restriction endonuclease [Streptomyces sp. NBC_00335]|uniref:restriction endonuclease n=1 Tax=unclassified Streptomyces TaxID=2593676 RepID=UPI00224E422E|nr:MULTISPECIES: restriction endonuclease [unclassified Streptomyces]MCX5403084.1 restriction endonuclease [Streptomyces sp. NBC_00086]
MTLPGEGRRKAGGGSAPFGRDVVLAVGLVGICVGGLAVFLKTAAGAGAEVWVVPVAAAVVLAVGVALAKWSVSPVRRRSTTPGAPGPAAHGDPYPIEATAVRDVPAAGEVPDVGSSALDHAAADADGFEHTIAALCARDGCTPVEVVGGAGDLGADVIATTPDGLRVVVQCKHYADTHRVGSQDLQRFGGTCFAVHGADVAIVVTTSSYTAPALEYAAACGIVCVDGEALAAWTDSAAAPPWEADSRDAAARVSTA